jgi:SNF2 family DNA or RNA helicase
LGIGSSNLTEDSPKFQLALTLVEELIANGEKALVFTSYNEMIDSFVLEIGGRFPETFVHNLDGRVPIQDRQDLIERFNSSEGSGVLICNPVVAGAGLNITGANHVIHYNLEWNPAKEDQATFRVYRNGQTKHTFVHRLFYIDTIDEVIDQRILRKRQLADLTVDSISDVHDYKAALSITPKRAR